MSYKSSCGWFSCLIFTWAMCGLVDLMVTIAMMPLFLLILLLKKSPRSKRTSSENIPYGKEVRFFEAKKKASRVFPIIFAIMVIAVIIRNLLIP